MSNALYLICKYDCFNEKIDSLFTELIFEKGIENCTFSNLMDLY